MDEDMKRIEGCIRTIRFRLAINVLFDGAAKGLVCGACLALVFCGAALVIPWYEVHWFVAGAVVFGLALGLAAAARHIPKMREAALVGDAAGLDEALITALELRDKSDAFSFLQRKSAARKLNGFSVKGAVKLCFPWKTGLLFAAFLAVCFGLMSIPAPARVAANQNHAAVAQLEEKKGDIEKLREALDEEVSLSPASRQELADILDEALAELQKPESARDKSYGDALKRLDMKLSKAARGSSDQAMADHVLSMAMDLALPSAREANAMAQALEDGLKKMSDPSGKPLADTMGEAALKKLAKDMAMKSAAGGLSREDYDQLASGSELDASSLKALADDAMGQLAAQNMDIQKLSGDSPDGGGSDGDGSITGLADNSGENGSRGGSASGSGSGAGSASGSGGSASGSGNGAGGAGNGSGGSASGSGNGTGSGSGAGGASGSGSGTGSGWNYGSKQGFERAAAGNGASEEMLNLPGGVSGDDENLHGQKSGGQTSMTRTENALTYAGQSVNYSQVLGDYSASAYSQIEQSAIPDGMKDLVRDYFSSLNSGQ